MQGWLPSVSTLALLGLHRGVVPGTHREGTEREMDEQLNKQPAGIRVVQKWIAVEDTYG